MTFEQFITKYDGKGVNYDGAYGNQCVDLYRQYVKEVCNVPQSPSVAGAKDIWNNYLSAHFDRIANTPTGVPSTGDIVIWGSAIGQFGHIAIFISGNTKTFTSFDQNWPDTGGKGVAHKQSHDYKGVLGWLRLKSTTPPPPPPSTAPAPDPKDAEIARLATALRDRTDELTKAMELNRTLGERNEDLARKLEEATTNIGTQKQAIEQLTEDLKECTAKSIPDPAPEPEPTPEPQPQPKLGLVERLKKWFNLK